MNDTPSPFSIHPDEQLEARITAWVLGEASPFEIAELESLVAKSPELQLFLARTLAIHSLLQEAETTANAPSEDWKLPDEKRAKLSPILGDIHVLIPEKEFRIRRASFRAAWGIAAVLILTFFTERFLFIPATSDKNMSQTVRNTADIAYESGAPLEKATPVEIDKKTGSPASIGRTMLTRDESAMASGGSVAYDAGSDGTAGIKKHEAETLKNTRPSARRDGQAESSVELERAIVGSRERPVETSINRATLGAILNNTERTAKARNPGDSESKKPIGKVGMIAGSILETEGSSRAASLGLPPTPSESELAPLAAAAVEKASEDSVSLPQNLARSLRDKAQKKADLSDLSTEIPAAQEPFSTFSLNISDASFQLALAAVEKGERPDPASIKTEQFYNAVDYGDPAPSSLEPVAAAIDQTAHPVIPGRHLVRVAIRTASTGRTAAQPLRLTLLVDQSGSMARADRRAAMDTALAQLATLLTENDQVTVIGFSRTLRLIADSLPGNEAAKIPDLINPSASEGGTNLEQALNLSSELALRHQLDGAQNRIVLFTDGAANLGDADPDRLAERVKELRQQGLAFDIAGIGTNDTNDRLLSELARHGNGRYYLVGENTEASLAAQLAGAFRLAAQNVKVQVKLNPERVGNYKLIGFEKDRLKTEDFHDDSVDAAELAADEAGVAIYQVETLPEGSGEIGEVSVRFRDTASGEMAERAWTIPHDPTTPAFDKAAPQTQLATLALMAAQKLQGGPLADAIRFPDHAETIAKLKQTYANDAKTQRMFTLITAPLLFSTLSAEENIAPKEPKEWARWVEKLHPITDAQGHGPDIGSDEWMGALDKKLGITDKEGHGPDIGSEEWRSAVEKKLQGEKRELLSSHSTLARFDGLKDHRCMGLTSLCPDECGHSGKLASFKIIKYLAYEKPGEYGDPKQETFQILIQDNKGNTKVAENILTAIRTLKPGDEVKLDWNHDYVTKGGSSSPERPITKLEKSE